MRKNHLHTATALAFVLAASACSHTGTPGGTTTAAAAAHETEAPLASLTVDQLSGMLDQHLAVAVFDNNSPESYAHGHIPGARWLAFDQVTADALGPNHDTQLVFYCHNEECHACHTAARQAIALGYHNVSILPQGIVGWTAAGKTVEPGSAAPTPAAAP